jgi:cyclopropane fatty-acyl-phospholipid synthase-like methyltransferase
MSNYIPPLEMRRRLGSNLFDEADDYLSAGITTFNRIKQVCQLKPSHKVLDLGSGCGRVALPLILYLDHELGGHYEGLEVAKDMVEWCQQSSLSSTNANFTWADLHSQQYFPEGKHKPEDYIFPYNLNSMDTIFACSLFTHMFPEGVLNYLNEIAGVMKPSGKFYTTIFMITPEAELRLQSTSVFKFRYSFTPVNSPAVLSSQDCRYEMEDRKDIAVAYSKGYFEELLALVKLKIDWMKQGTWSKGVPNWTQDELVIVHSE